MKASYLKYILQFKRPSGTSRGVMTQKETWFLLLEDKDRIGIGECGLLRGLSIDDVPNYEKRLQTLCQEVNNGAHPRAASLEGFPSIRFGLEQALASLNALDPFQLFPSNFTRGLDCIPINGLVWMGDRKYMMSQLGEKLDAGFRCLKLKIGALDFNTELGILGEIRKEYTEEEIEIRVDANGAFSIEEAAEKLKRLSELALHSIEQPIGRGQWEAMAALCHHSPLPIALDEELIGVENVTEREKLLQTIQPQYLILKPSLLGGYESCQHWIDLAGKTGARWWVTSALESNIGLNAIAQWTYRLDNKLPQGLGTGSLYTNNFSSPLVVDDGCLSYDPSKGWSQILKAKLCI